MIKYFKKYWVYLVALIFLLLPKLVDFLYGIYFCDLTSLHRIGASDLLNYLGSIIGGLLSLVAILVAIKQFKTEKKPIIIPRNKHLFISNISNRIILHENPELDNISYDMFSVPLPFTLENATDNAAITFDLVVNYNGGRWYREICGLIGGEPSEELSSNFDKDEFMRQGVFNSNSTKTLHMTDNLRYILMGIHYRLTETGVNKNDLALRNSHFIRKSYKVAELELIAKDISGKKNTTVFDIEMALSNVILKESMYEVLFTFVMQE